MIENIDILKNNILIAEFMGRKFYAYSGNKSYKFGFSSYKFCIEAIQKYKWVGYTPELGWQQGVGEYHTSWDWLMPVWQKCKEIGFWMCCNGFGKLWNEKSKEIEVAISMEINCEKSAIKIAELIEWYNENNKQNENTKTTN
jgi:hypothetical protein